MHLRTRGLHFPAELDFDPLHEMARDLDVAHVGRMPLRRNIILLKNTCRVEVMNKVALSLEMLVDVLDLIDPQWSLDEGVLVCAEATP